MIATLESQAPQNIVALPQPVKTKRSLEDLQKTVSASRLNLWNTCRLKFYFRYVLQINKPKTAALFVGSRVHDVLQAWSMARWKKEELDLGKLKQQFDQQWHDQQKTTKINWDGDEEKDRSGAWTALECYLEQTPIKPDEKPEAVEVSVEADLERYGLPRLIGVLDLVRQGGRIVDFKTCAQTPNPEMVRHTNELQLCCYAVLYRHCTGHLEGGLEIHSIVKTKTPKVVITELPPMTPRQQIRLFKGMESYLEGICREDFVPSPSFTCAGCEFLAECRVW